MPAGKPAVGGYLVVRSAVVITYRVGEYLDDDLDFVFLFYLCIYFILLLFICLFVYYCIFWNHDFQLALLWGAYDEKKKKLKKESGIYPMWVK